MGFREDYYDFLCGNDRRLVKVCIQNNTFHSITIEADIARTIDFSGGTRKVETIRLAKCMKASRIIWPDRTGAIRRLYISNCDSLTRLDISALTSLEDLSIVNCRSLEEIVGIPSTLKELNAHNTKLNKIDVSDASNLHRLNITTSSPVFDVDLMKHQSLQILSIVTSKAKSDDKPAPSSIKLKNAHSLHKLFIDTGSNDANIHLDGCTFLADIIIECGDNSTIEHLDDCINLEFAHIGNSAIAIEKKAQKLIDELSKDESRTVENEINAQKNLNRAFYELATTSSPSKEDRETVVAQNGSLRETEGGGKGVKIILLSIPEELLKLVDERDLMMAKSHMQYDDTRLLRDPGAFAYFIQRPAYLEDLGELLPNAHRRTKIKLRKGEVFDILENDYQQAELTDKIIPTDKEARELVLGWIKNKEDKQPNILILTDQDIQHPLIYRFLREIPKHPKYILFDGQRYTFGQYDRILFVGNWFYIKNRLPYLAGMMNRLSLHSLVPSTQNRLSITTHKQQRYTRKMLSAYRLLNDSRAMNAESELGLNQNKMKQLLNDFFNNLRYLQFIENLELERMQQEREMALKDQTHDTQVTQSNNTPQHSLTSSDTPKNQATYSSGLPDQDPIGGQSSTKPRSELDDQSGIEAEANAKPRSELDDQSGIEAEANAKPRNELDDQFGIDAEANAKPRSELDDQFGIDAEANAKPRSELDDQSGIEAEANAKPRSELDDQFGIDAEANAKPRSELDDQVAINAEARANTLKNTEKVNSEGTHDQLQMQAADNKSEQKTEKLKDTTPMSTEDTHAQKVLGAKKSKHQGMTPLQTNPQILFERNRGADEPLQPDDALEQHFIDVSEKRTENPTGSLFTPAQPRKPLEDYDDQVLIDVEKTAPSENPNAALLDAAKQLALAVKKMAKSAGSVDNKQDEKSNSLASASQMTSKAMSQLNQIKMTEIALKDPKANNYKEKLLTAADSLIHAMKSLYTACANELPLTVKKVNTEKESEEERLVKNYLLHALSGAKQQYIENNSIQTKSEGMFGAGFKAGIHMARLKILETVIDAIDKREVIPEVKVNEYLSELAKDKQLNCAISGHRTLIIHYLAANKNTDMANQPQDKAK